MYTDRNSQRKYTQSQIDENYRISRGLLFASQLEEWGYNFCSRCQDEYNKIGIVPINDMEHHILDCSHIKSRQHCKNDSDIEKIWDLDNLQILCRSCHKVEDGLNLQR